MAGSGGFGSKRGGRASIKVHKTLDHGKHGQIARFYKDSKTLIGSDTWTFNDAGVFGCTGSMNVKGNISHSGSILPENGTDTLGSQTYKYSNIHATDISTDNLNSSNLYTGDLHLKNERGDWTMFEEADKLVVKNNLTGELFSLMLEKIEK
tara:strand:- start:14 stop:466 length:453 start_codon:yes stop_codon:yes gene_type:complete